MALRASLQAEEAQFHSHRLDFQEHKQIQKDKKRARSELETLKSDIKRAKKAAQQIDAVAMARDAEKTYCAWELGKGKPNGGGDECKKARAEVLQRLRSVAKLSPQQENDWEYFVTSWDREMANAQGEEWGTVFAEIIQNLSNQLEAGNKNALSEFMYNETKRVLANVPNRVLPGAS